HVERLLGEVRAQRAAAKEANRAYDPGRPLLEIVRSLCRSHKSRLGSHTRAAFVTAFEEDFVRARIPELAQATAIVERQARQEGGLGVSTAEWADQDRDNLRCFAHVLRHGHELPGARLNKFLGVRYLFHLHESRNRYTVRRGFPVARRANSSPVFAA